MYDPFASQIVPQFVPQAAPVALPTGDAAGVPLSPNNALNSLKGHPAFRQAMLAYKGLRPDFSTFAQPADFRAAMLDWRGQRPVRASYFGGRQGGLGAAGGL
jgi:hypothetical protein